MDPMGTVDASEILQNHLGCKILNLVNSGIKHLLNWCRISEPSTEGRAKSCRTHPSPQMVV